LVQAKRSTGISKRASSKPFISREFVISEQLNTFNNTGEMGLDAFHLFGSRNRRGAVWLWSNIDRKVEPCA
jgi:hypothetical protein